MSYTAAAVCAPVLVVALELAVLRTGILRQARFWLTLVITLAFQVPVDGWLTKLSAPVVSYQAGAISGLRWPWDIPVEDFGFGIALVTLTLVLWERARRAGRVPGGGDGRELTRARPAEASVTDPRPAGGGSRLTDPRPAALLAAARLTVRRGLAGVWVRGQLPPGPVVLAASHHSWWDPMIAWELLAQRRRRAVLVADAANLRQYRFARHLGVIGTDEPRSGLAALRAGAVLVIYPETRLLPAGPPGPLASGAAWFAQQAPARLCSAAVRVLLRGGQFAEAYVILAEVGADGARAAVTARLHDQLRHDLAELDRLNARTDPRTPLPGLRRSVRGRHGWDERVDAVQARWRAAVGRGGSP